MMTALRSGMALWVALLLGGFAWSQGKQSPPPPKPTAEIQKLIDAATSDKVEWKDGIPLLEKALARARDIHDRAGEGGCLVWLGRSWVELGQPEKALDFYQQALAIKREVKDRAGEGTVLGNIGVVYSALGQPEKALDFLQQALVIFREVKDRRGEGAALAGIGYVYRALGQSEKALDCYQQSLAIEREVKDRAGEGTMLNNIGLVYQALGQREKALDFYKQSLVIAREVKDRAGEGATLNSMGYVYQAFGQPEKALDFYQQSLVIKREVKDRAGEGAALYNIGNVLWHLGQQAKALDSYQQSLAILREVRDRAGEGSALGNIGGVYSDLGQTEKALDSYQQALAIAREVKDRAGEAVTLSNIGLVYSDLGQPDKALDFLQQALAIQRDLKDRAGEGTTLGNIGLVYQDLGQPEKALDFYQQALAIQREGKDREVERRTLYNIGEVYVVLDQPEKALDVYQQALAIDREVKDRLAEGTMLNNIGVVYLGLGQPAKALDSYQQSLAILREIGDRWGEGTVLGATGGIYMEFGQPNKALDCYQLSLVSFRAVNDRRGEGAALGGNGSVYSRLDQPQKALDFFQQALALARAMKDRAGEGVALGGKGSVYSRLGQPEKALDFFQQALAIAREGKDRAGEGTCLMGIGACYRDLGQPEKALDFDQRALLIAREVKDQDGERLTLYNAAFLIGLTQPRAAAWLGSMGLGKATELRKDAPTDASTERSLAESLAGDYRDQGIRLLVQGRLPEAEEMVRLLASSQVQEQEIPRSPLEVGWTARYEAFMSRYAPIVQEEKRLADLTAQRTALEAEFKTLMATIFAEAKAADPAKDRVAETRASREADAALARLGPTARIVYALPEYGQGKDQGQDKIHLLVVSSAGRVARTIPAQDLKEVLKTFGAAVRHPHLDPRPSGEKLYTLLVKPLEADLDPQGVTMWRLLGDLADVPLGALWDGKAFLVQSRRFARFAPEEIAALAEAPLPRGGGVALFGTSQARQTREPWSGLPLSFPALPGVSFETARVGALWSVKPELDASFTPESLVQAIQGKPRVLYLATHFSAYPGDDRRSFLLTGTGAPWSVETLKGLAPDALSSVELVVLSACATAVGRSATGDEAESLGSWLERKGARSVLSTLWSLDDCGAAVLAPEFCRIWTAHPEGTKLDALRAAQRAMIAGTLTPQSVGYPRGAKDVSPTSNADAPPWPSTLPPFSHPYYWAPFILTGNWK